MLFIIIIVSYLIHSHLTYLQTKFIWLNHTNETKVQQLCRSLLSLCQCLLFSFGRLLPFPAGSNAGHLWCTRLPLANVPIYMWQITFASWWFCQTKMSSMYSNLFGPEIRLQSECHSIERMIDVNSTHIDNLCATEKLMTWGKDENIQHKYTHRPKCSPICIRSVNHGCASGNREKYIERISIIFVNRLQSIQR